MSKLLEWQKLQEQLKVLKDKELALRREICSEILGGRRGEISEKSVYEGIPVRVKMTVTRNVDEDVLNTLWTELSESEKMAIKFKPSVVLAEYIKLKEDSLLHEAVTVKPSETPNLEVLK